MDVQTRRDISRLKIEVKLSLSADRKSYMRRRLAQRRLTLSDLECLKSTSSASHAISAVAELLVSYGAASYPRAAVNGHPTNAPSAVKNTAPGTLSVYQQPIAIMVVFMTNELGKNAVEDVNMPAAKTSAASVKRPVFTPN